MDSLWKIQKTHENASKRMKTNTLTDFSHYMLPEPYTWESSGYFFYISFFTFLYKSFATWVFGFLDYLTIFLD